MVKELLQQIPTGLTDNREIEFLCGMIYDELISGEPISDDLISRHPITAIRILDQERFYPTSQAAAQLELYATLRVAEHIPGMTWSEFKKLTPVETEVVFKLARNAAARSAQHSSTAGKGLDNLDKALAEMKANTPSK